MKKHRKEDCFYFTGVYCENTHEYECARGHCTCHACFEYMNWWQRLCMRIEVELLQRRIRLDSIFHKRELFRRKNILDSLKERFDKAFYNLMGVGDELEKLKIECDMYKTYYRAKHNDIDGKIFKYKEALEEIRHILKIHEEELNETLHTPIDEMILKIINEVLDERNRKDV